MITRLKRCAYAQIVTIVLLALWAALAASPAAANAKATPLAKDPQPTDQAAGVTGSVVVAPGDSLWTISAGWLGPEATTQQIADGVERIYALNEQQIGSSPDLILAGQRLLLPSEVERRALEPEEAASARHAGEPTAPNPRSRTASNRSDTVAEAVVGIADRRARHARGDARSEPASLPGLARPAPVSEVRTLARNDSPPSLAQSVVSDARSIFSAVATTAVEPSSPGSYPGRKVLGGALLAMSCVLALILAVRVAQEVWGPSYARRQARRRWVREALARSYAANGTFDARVAFAPVEGGHPSQHSPQPAPTQTAAAGDTRTSVAPSGHRVNGSALLDTVQNISRRRQLRIRKTRPLKAKRPARGHVKGASGAARLSRARRGHATRVQRARALSRKGRRIVGSEHRDPHPVQEWKIGEPLRSAMNAILVQPGAPLRDALLGVKPIVADELTTVASLERHRALSYNEQRQARALRKFLATIEKVCDDRRVG